MPFSMNQSDDIIQSHSEYGCYYRTQYPGADYAAQRRIVRAVSAENIPSDDCSYNGLRS